MSQPLLFNVCRRGNDGRLDPGGLFHHCSFLRLNIHCSSVPALVALVDFLERDSFAARGTP